MSKVSKVSRVKTFYTKIHEMRIQYNGMFAKMTPDTPDRPDSDTSRRLVNLDLSKFRDRARTLGGATTREFRSTTPPAVAPQDMEVRVEEVKVK